MFDQYYQQSSDELKLRFLEHLLSEDAHLQEKFTEFYQKGSGAENTLTADPWSYIRECEANIKDALEDLSFEDVSYRLDSHRDDFHYSDLDLIDDAIQEEYQSQIEEQWDEAIRDCRENRFDRAFYLLMGAFRACQSARPENEHTYFETEQFISMLKAERQRHEKTLQSMVAPEDQIVAIASELCREAKHYDSHPQKILTFFEPPLCWILQTASAAQKVSEILETYSYAHFVPWLASRLSFLIHGNEGWEQHALRYCNEYPDLARQLLQFYRDQQRDGDFLQLAEKLWRVNLIREKLADYLFEQTDSERAPEICLKVSIYLLESKCSNRYYRVLFKLLPYEERLPYLQKLQAQPEEHCKALILEGMVVEALNYVEYATSQYNFTTLLPVVIQAAPGQSAGLVERKLLKFLEDARGRSFYESVARVLKFFSEQPGREQKARHIALRLIKANYRLYALKQTLNDELNLEQK